MKEKLGTKQIAFTGILLAICIVSQIFKNLSIFITGPIINACIVLAVLIAGVSCGIILSVITPVAAYFIAASPVMTAWDPKPKRVRNIFICSGVVFCASSRMI